MEPVPSHSLLSHNDSGDTTMLVQIEEAKCAIHKLSFVTVRLFWHPYVQWVQGARVPGFAFVLEMPRV